MIARFPLFMGALALLASAPATAALSPAEQVMVRTVDAEQQRTTAMLQRWVDQNSGTMNIAGVEAVRRMVEPEFQQLGFKTQWIEMKAAGRAGHLVARHVGSRKGKRLLLIAHLDTVFEADSPFQRWVPDGNLAHGPGAGDDKGGIAVIVAALRAMQAAGTLKNANITVFLTGDEEDAGSPLSISRRDLIAEGKKADAALDFEDLAQEDGPNGPVDMGSTARRSAGSWTRDGHRPRRALGRRRSGQLRRDLRAGADHRPVPPRAARGQADLQCRTGRRGPDGEAGRRQDPPGRHWQDQHHRGDRGRARGPARDQPGPDRPHPGEDARHRRPAARRRARGDQLRRG